MKKLQSIKFTPKELSEVISELDPMNSPQFRNTDENTAGRLFAEVFRPVLRFNKSRKAWACYDGIRWKTEPGCLDAELCAQELARALELYALMNKSASEPSGNELNYQKFSIRLGERQKRLRMIEDAKPLITVTETDFDQDSDLLNLRNCVLNLRTGKQIPHYPELMLSKVCNAAYDPKADPAAWEKFISEIMQEDPEKIEYLQRVLSYGMLGTNTEEKFFMFYGSSTRNGKSTLLETISYLLGDYAESLPPEALAQKQRDSSRPNEEIAKLRGIRFVQMSEPSKRMVFDVALLKNLTGGDRIACRYMYGHSFNYYPAFKVFINTNYLPVVTDDTLFASDRCQLLTFDKHFTKAEQNQNLKDIFRRPENLSAVLNWLLAGLDRYKVRGLDPVQAVEEATKEYRADSDKVQKFIDECLEYAPGRNVKVKILYQVYAKWCSESGYGTDNKSNFIQDLKAKNLFAKSGTVDGRTFHNVIKDHAVKLEYQI